jgi:pyruvate kinase
MKKLTKIVATMGPGLSYGQIAPLIEAGVDCFRFNYKHHDYAWHKERLGWVKEVSQKLGRYTGTLLDLQGPEVRITLAESQLAIHAGDWILLSDVAKESFEPCAIVSHPEIVTKLGDNDRVFVSGGTFEFTVTHRGSQVFLVSKTSGTLKSRQTLSVPNHPLSLPTLSPSDITGIKLATEMEVTFVAVSFVRNEADLKEVAHVLEREGCHSELIAKIETTAAYKNLDNILALSHGVMVARGDLAIETSMAQVPFLQKKIIRQALKNGKPVITATQMLESMIVNKQPTRAEISDVANAAYDYSDAVMLSAETAIGAYPVQTVETMSQILAFNEQKTSSGKKHDYEVTLPDAEAAIAEAAFNLNLALANHRQVKAFVTFTRSGYTPSILSLFHPHLPILTFCASEAVARQLSLRFGVLAVYNPDVYPVEPAVSPEKVLQGIHHLTRLQLLHGGDSVIVLHENAWGFESGTSSIKLIRVPE